MRYRLQYNFWLNHNKPDDVTVADTIELLKNQRAFTQVVKDGIMLVNELRQGKTELLVKLYPWIADRFTPAPAGGAGQGELERQIDDLKKLITQYRNEATMHDAPLVAAGAPPVKLSALQPIAATVDDDDEQDTIILKRNTSTDAGKNFLGSLASFR